MATAVIEDQVDQSTLLELRHEKISSGFPTRFDTNRAVQPQLEI